MSICEQYATDVLSGKIVACELVINACNRFLRDKQDTRFKWVEQDYLHAVDFIQELEHTTGSLKGNKFILEPWQHFILGNLFGFRNTKTGYRRFQVAYVEVPRKNGKSNLAAAINLYGLLADGESGAQVYSAATKLKQATIVFDEMARVCRQVDWISDEINSGLVKVYNSVHTKRIQFQTSYASPLEWSPDSMDGLNAHFCVIDEYHAHKTDAMYNVMMNSMGARQQPLLFTITTAGFNKESPCFKHRQYCQKILNGVVENESLFTMIFTLDEADDWRDEKNWAKANPNYGVSVVPEFIEQKFIEAKERVSKEVEFKTKLLNIWTDSELTWISDEKWNALVASDELAIGECFGGLDLAQVSDFCAYSLFWPETNYLKTWYFIPEEAVQLRNDSAGESIREWMHQEYIIVTPGNVADYDYILSKINELSEKYGRPKDIAFDRYNSSQLVIYLIDEGYEMFKFGQGFISMSTPTKELERLVLNGELRHDGNPCCRWMMSNILLETDPAGNVKISKKKSGDKVDGPVSKVMAIGTYLDEKLKSNNADKNEFFFQIL